MRKMLLLAPFDIFPPVHGGSAVVYGFLKYTSVKNEVHALLTHLHSQKGRQDIIRENLNITYCPASIFDNLRMLSILLNPFYFVKAYKLMKASGADVILCEVLWTGLAGLFLKKVFNRPVILVELNAESLKYKEMGGIAHRVFSWFLRRIERYICQRVEKIVVLSEIDRGHLCQFYGIKAEKITVIPPCLDLDDFVAAQSSREGVRKLYGIHQEIVFSFVGNLEYWPNIEAVKYISEMIYPAIRTQYPQCKCWIIGRASEELSCYRKEGIIFTGYLDKKDLLAHVSASDIVLVPIETGSGVRIKIIEAAACGKPIVSTRKGAEGLDFVHEEDILLADRVDERFIEAIFRLIEDESLRMKLGENARHKVVTQYGWETAVQQFEAIYEEVRQ